MNDLIKGGQAVFDRVSTLDQDSEGDEASK
jgi:hypothetical protein